MMIIILATDYTDDHRIFDYHRICVNLFICENL